MNSKPVTDSNSTTSSDRQIIWKIPLAIYVGYLSIVSLLFIYLYDHGLNRMVNNWFEREEYSHGILIPFLTIFLIWQKKDVLEKLEFSTDKYGILVVISGVFLILLGEISAITVFIQYGFAFIVAGLAFSYLGLDAFKHVAIPYFLLLFMIPLPAVIFQELSQQLQLISTVIGVSVIRLFNISVFVEGNVIDLGTYKLQVVEACSGLRYLFPLMTLGFIASYMYKVEFWKRVIVFLSSIPITVLMNSFRIGVIGITVEYWGIEMAEGFLHDFEGWIVFMACTFLLVLEMWLLVKVGKIRKPLTEAFGIDMPEPAPENSIVKIRPISRNFIIASVLVLVTIVGSYIAPNKEDYITERSEFVNFPQTLGKWSSAGSPPEYLTADVINALKFDDYLLSSYNDGSQRSVNLYIAYYGSQSKGASIHSPRACMPGGGWEIQTLQEHVLEGVILPDGNMLKVNRVVIQLGDTRQLVYYWFPQRGRNVTNEYMLKWYVFWDSLTRNRSDGALVRLTTLVRPGEDITIADARLSDMALEMNRVLGDFIPE